MLSEQDKGVFINIAEISMNIWSHKNRLVLAVFAFLLCNVIANILTNKFAGSSANWKNAL